MELHFSAGYHRSLPDSDRYVPEHRVGLDKDRPQGIRTHTTLPSPVSSPKTWGLVGSSRYIGVLILHAKNNRANRTRAWQRTGTLLIADTDRMTEAFCMITFEGTGIDKGGQGSFVLRLDPSEWTIFKVEGSTVVEEG